MADVAAVVVAYNSRADVARCLDDLAAQEGVELETVVIDNGSTDGTVELLRRRAGIRLIENGENRWLAPAWNQGVRETAAPYVLFLTPDASLLDRDAVARLRAALEARPEAGLAGPRLFDAEGTETPNGAFGFPTPRWVIAVALGLGGRLRLREKPPPRAEPAEVVPARWVNGACMLARRSALARVGGLDERFRLYFEEVDLAKRLHDAGVGVLLVRSARAVHRWRGSEAPSELRERAFAHGERLYFRKHHGRAAELAVRAARALERLRKWVFAR